MLFYLLDGIRSFQVKGAEGRRNGQVLERGQLGDVAVDAGDVRWIDLSGA